MNGCTTILIALGALTLYSMNKKNRPPTLYVQDKLVGGFNAMTVPPVGIFIRTDQLENGNLVEHEIMHWEQYRKLGLLGYYLGYLSQSCRFGYDKMPMELEARVGECEPCKSQYTQCVRKGIARTVYNPDFRK
jgi:hypothetical protein